MVEKENRDRDRRTQLTQSSSLPAGLEHGAGVPPFQASRGDHQLVPSDDSTRIVRK